eukprot:4473635-Amphidinium_carterae.2
MPIGCLAHRSMASGLQEASTVMPVNGSDFHEVLDRFGLLAKYQEFCSRHDGCGFSLVLCCFESGCHCLLEDVLPLPTLMLDSLLTWVWAVALTAEEGQEPTITITLQLIRSAGCFFNNEQLHLYIDQGMSPHFGCSWAAVVIISTGAASMASAVVVISCFSSSVIRRPEQITLLLWQDCRVVDMPGSVGEHFTAGCTKR